MKVLQILFLIFGLIILVNAQKSLLSGTVYDYAGSEVSGAKIEATDSKNKVFTAYTNENGFYKLDLLEGAYKIDITFSILNKFSISDYWITYKMQLDAALQCKNDCKTIADPIIILEGSKKQNKRKINKQ